MSNCRPTSSGSATPAALAIPVSSSRYGALALVLRLLGAGATLTLTPLVLAESHGHVGRADAHGLVDQGVAQG
jgi:hypothetical protein